MAQDRPGRPPPAHEWAGDPARDRRGHPPSARDRSAPAPGTSGSRERPGRQGVGRETRRRILDAAASVLADSGLTRATTKEIARVAGCSEAALYKHFRDKEEIFVLVLRERGPALPDTLAGLPARVGLGELRAHLVEVAEQAVAFYRETFPMAGSLFASPDLLAVHRRRLAEERTGPHVATRLLAGYLAAEQRQGRVAPGVDPDAAALLIIGACFHRAFLDRFYADEPPGDAPPALTEPDILTRAVDAALAGLAAGSPVQ